MPPIPRGVKRDRSGRRPGANRGVPRRVPTDPLVADDAGCIVCGRPRPRIAVLHGDPFCRRACCELHYLGESTAASRKAGVEEAAA